MQYRLLFFLGVISLTHQQGKNIQGLIEEIFKNQNGTNVQPKNPTDPNACECVPYYLCTDSGVINTMGEGIIDIRADEDGCESYLDVCCKLAKVTSNPIVPDKTLNVGCGWRNSEGAGFRITGDKDNETLFGEFPWMVAVLYEDFIEGFQEVLNVYQCGGSLIHPSVVMTAAHCVSNNDRTYKIRAGEWDTQTTKEIYRHQDRGVKSITIHPQFYAPAVLNDVAILFLDSPINMSDPHIGLACLPPLNAIIPGGTRCFVTGWGKDKYGQEGRYQVILKKIDLPIVDRDTCQANLRRTRLGNYFQLDKSFVCAGGELGKDSCKGDGGGPLVCPIPGVKLRYQQVGMVAWGIGCGEADIPGVYVNVPLFRNWVDQEIAYNNLDISSYAY